DFQEFYPNQFVFCVDVQESLTYKRSILLNSSEVQEPLKITTYFKFFLISPGQSK
ncbi:1345_t:CDS:2, partial [Entrophospora sp. SA101]